MVNSDTGHGEPIRLMVGTGNDHKVEEIAAILADLPLKVFGARELSDFPEIDESGSTFEENALIKARAFARSALQLDPVMERPQWVLSDDSGLCVDALGGAPGVHSARYAADLVDHPTDEDNNRKLLKELRGKDRRARFVCTLALVEVPDSTDAQPALILQARGECHGVIVDAARGGGGFGYDPLFLLEDLGRTMAELPPAEKNRRSHRAIALERFREALLERLKA